MRYLIPLVLLALPLFAQTTPATEPPPAEIKGAPSYDDLYVDFSDVFRDSRCRDNLTLPLFELLQIDAHSVTQYLTPRPMEGAVPKERLRAGEPQSQRGPVDDPVKVRDECEHPDPPAAVMVTAL